MGKEITATLNEFVPYPKQQEIIDAATKGKCKNISVCTGRQVGKTALAVFLSIYYLLDTQKCNVGFITPVHSTGKKIYDDICKALRTSEDLAPYITFNQTTMSIKIEFTKRDVRQLKFFSAERYDNIRGNTFTELIIDEAAYIKNQAYNSAIKPTTLVKCRKIVMFSTPKGKNWFYDICMMAKKYKNKLVNANYKTFTFATSENPYIDEDVLKEFKDSMPENMYRQEILGEFLENGSEVFNNVKGFVAKKDIISPSNKHFIGIDIGQSVDYTAITVLNEFGQIEELERFNQMTYEKIMERMIKTMNKYPKAFVYIEKNNVGSVIIESLMANPNLKNKRITAFVTTNQSKNDLIENLIKSMQTAEIKNTGCLNTDLLVSEMESFVSEYSFKTHTLKYGALSGFHDDMIISLALANKCRLVNKNVQTPKVFIYGND
jgi:hypothetical protein